MVRILVLGLLLTMLVMCCSLSAEAGDGVIILCYHDVGPVGGNGWTVSKERLLAHFNYLKHNGYSLITLKQYTDACERGVPLPTKPVLLTFDDGYRSFYREVFPLLKEFRYPAVLSVVTAWKIGYKPPDIGELITWRQMREAESSGLVTIAVHSHNLHRYLPLDVNPRRPAALPVRFADDRYETPQEYRSRISNDMEMARMVMEKGLGHQVSAYTWPYGEYTQDAMELGKAAGFKTFFTLLSGFNIPGVDGLSQAKRIAVSGATDEAELARMLATGTVDYTKLITAQPGRDIVLGTGSRHY
jgi:biofilm PGA synthesis lipoprotein PgaB